MRIGTPKPVYIGGKPHTTPVHLIKPSGNNTSDLAKLQGNRPLPPAQVGGGGCSPRGCPPPPKDPNRWKQHPNTKQMQEERDRIARRQVGGEFDGRYMSRNDIAAERQMQAARSKREAYYNAMSPMRGDAPLRAVDPITKATISNSPATSPTFEGTNKMDWLRKKRLAKIKRKHKDDLMPFEVR